MAGLVPMVSEVDGDDEAVSVGWKHKGSPGAPGALWPRTQSD